MDQFSGLCIRGPMDGQRATMQTTKLQVEVRSPQPPLSASIDDRAKALTAETETIWYDWTEIDGSSYWLLDGDTPESATEHVAEVIGFTAMASRYEQLIARQKDDARDR